MENLLARTPVFQTRLNRRFTKFAHTFSNLITEDLQLANVKRHLDQDLKLEGLLAVTACHIHAVCNKMSVCVELAKNAV